jgi:hypothetical protein
MKGFVMLRILTAIGLIVILGVGCSDDQNPVRQYGKTLTGSLGKAEKAKALADMRTIKTEIMRYKAEHDQFPQSLDDLNMKDINAGMYRYNTETGEVALAQ